MFKLKTEDEYIKRIQELEEELSQKTIRLRKYVIKSILENKDKATTNEKEMQNLNK